MCLNVLTRHAPDPHAEPQRRYKLMLLDPFTNELCSLYVRTQRWLRGHWYTAAFVAEIHYNCRELNEWTSTHHTVSEDQAQHGFHVYLTAGDAITAATQRYCRPIQIMQVEVRGLIAEGTDGLTGLPSESWRECRVL